MSDERAIEVRNVGYRVEDRCILADINFDVGQGEIVSLMGMSGSGKTTLLKCLGGLLRPTSGTIRIGADEIVGMAESALNRVRTRIGFVFQYAALFDSMTVFDNVAFGLRQHRSTPVSDLARIVKERLADVSLEGAEDLYPAELSGGMQKRVGLARALAMEPSVLLYDEPTSGLDPVIGRAIDDLIVETRDRLGVTSVVVSHHVETVFRISDRIAMLRQGRMMAMGSAEDLRQSDEPLIREFVHGGDGAASAAGPGRPAAKGVT